MARKPILSYRYCSKAYLWLLTLSFRSAMGLELVVSYDHSIETLKKNQPLLKSCLYGCIYPGAEQDSAKSLEVFKLILSSITPSFEILHDCVHFASRSGQTGHLSELLRFYPISEDFRFSVILASTNPATVDLLLSGGSETLKKSYQLVTGWVKQINAATNSIPCLKEFGFWATTQTLEVSEESWTALLRSAIATQQIPAINFLLDLNKTLRFYVSITLFAAAINTNNQDLIELVLPFVDCKQDLNSPRLETLSSLLNEYCKTPKSVLFGRLELPLSFTKDLVIKQRQLVLQHQLGAIHSIVGAMGKLNNGKLSIPSAAIWSSIKFHNPEITNLLQTLGGVTSWMDTPNDNKYKIDDRNDSAVDTPTDADGSAFGIMQALGGKRSKYGQMAPALVEDEEVAPYESISTRDNIFTKSSQSLLGIKRLENRETSLKMSTEVSVASNNNQPRTQPAVFDFKTESNRIWEAYFQSDKNTIISRLSNTNLEGMDWMEISKPTSKRPEPENSHIGEDEREILNRYLALY
jgi:hypothetical protein